MSFDDAPFDELPLENVIETLSGYAYQWYADNPTVPHNEYADTMIRNHLGEILVTLVGWLEPTFLGIGSTQHACAYIEQVTAVYGLAIYDLPEGAPLYFRATSYPERGLGGTAVDMMVAAVLRRIIEDHPELMSETKRLHAEHFPGGALYVP